MRCDLNYCIYNDGYNCMLKGISVDALGMCEECILVSVGDKDLKKLKRIQLKNLENRNQV